MTKPPQNMSSRYVRALLVEGKNDLFELVRVERRINSIDNIPIGIYFIATICSPTNDFTEASCVGATPEAALRRVLAAHGVTFR